MSCPKKSSERWHRLASAAVVSGLAWCACDSYVTPLLQCEKQDREATLSIQGQINMASTSALHTQLLEEKIEALRTEQNRLDTDVPGPSLPVFFPDQLGRYFSRSGLAVSTVQMTNVQNATGLPDYNFGTWTVTFSVPESNSLPAATLRALADFEQNHLFAKVSDFEFEPDSANPARQVGTLSLTTLFRQ